MKYLRELFIILSAFPLTVQGAEASYQDLARHSILEQLDYLNQLVSELDEESMPHETKILRKSGIGKMKLLLDLFAYAYPKERDDPWRIARQNLDIGYEIVGNYKDLWDALDLEISEIEPRNIPYNFNEVDQLRREVLEWKDSYRMIRDDRDLENYFDNPASQLVSRKKKKLSHLTWGATEKSPKGSLSGLGNLRLLAAELANTIENNLTKVDELKNIHSNQESEDEFHNIRKRARIILKLNRFFPDLFENTPLNQKALIALETLVDQFGDINDNILRHHKAEKKGDKNGMKTLEKIIDKEWKEVTQFIKTRKIAKLVRDFEAQLELDLKYCCSE